MKSVLVIAALLGAISAAAAQAPQQVTPEQQQAVVNTWDACIKSGGVPCVGLFNMYVVRPAEEAQKAAEAARNKPADPATKPEPGAPAK